MVTKQSIYNQRKNNINGGGNHYDFENILLHRYYLEHEVILKVDIFNKKVSKYLFKQLNNFRKRSQNESHEKLQKELFNFIFSLFELRKEKNFFYISHPNLIYDFFRNYYNYSKADIMNNVFNIKKLISPFSRKSHFFLEKEFNNINGLERNYQLVSIKDIIKNKKIYNCIQEVIKNIQNEIDNQNVILISFLYNKEQRHLNQKGFKNKYARHLAMIESYDTDYFYIRDSRNNINDDYCFKMKKDKLIFLSGGYKVFYISKIPQNQLKIA